ncbi:MAG TPA: lipid-A-disaccharide synthase N-terminal domain-containing protein [Phycisphaerae bacterium]|nr:lipid-A-disaccharide synthase N-terminal domain-containing protein [Phycisphaerae bacterium]
MLEHMLEKFLSRLPADPGQLVWFLIGMTGEFVFLMRFVVQWVASERKKRTVVPMVFWHLSLVGTFMVLAYAIYTMDPVFMLAYSLNIVIYVRNLHIARRYPAREAVTERTSE